MVAGTASMKKRVHFWNKMPMHSLIAFGLFLRLPEYRNLNQVCRILRSVYGFREEANFNLGTFSYYYFNRTANEKLFLSTNKS